MNIELQKYGFFDLQDVKDLNSNAKGLIISEISNSNVSRKIAWGEALGLINHIFLNHAGNKNGKRNKILSSIFRTSEDTVKKEINALAKPNTVNTRYKAATYLKEVKEVFKKLK